MFTWIQPRTLTTRCGTVTLTVVCCLLWCRADGLAQQVLSCLAKLKPAKDCVLGLAATLVLLMLTSEDAHPTYLASVAAAVLMDQLLQVSSLCASKQRHICWWRLKHCGGASAGMTSCAGSGIVGYCRRLCLMAGTADQSRLISYAVQ